MSAVMRGSLAAHAWRAAVRGTGAPGAPVARRLHAASRSAAQPLSSRYLSSSTFGAQAVQRLGAVGAAIFVAAVAVGAPATLAAPVADLEAADALFESRSLAACKEKLDAMYAANTSVADKAELCFRLARVCYNLLSSKDPADKALTATKAQRKALAEAALAYAKEAKEVAPNDFRSHYWCGIALQAVGDFMGTEFTISRLNEIRGYFEAASDLNPADGTALYCLGAWCYGLADLGWVSRKLASTLFATPPTSSYEDALAFFLKAEKVEPGFWNKNVLQISKTFEKLGDKAQAAKWAQVTLDRPVSNAEDEEFAKEAQLILKRNN